jgi:hypothetical protein
MIMATTATTTGTNTATTMNESDPKDVPLYAPTQSGPAVLARHRHAHRHGGGAVHVHWHDPDEGTSHGVTQDLDSAPPQHAHNHKTTARTALLLILGSSPMVEGIPAFFAAGEYGFGAISAMAVVFALSTIVTYVVLCVYSTVGLQRVHLGAFERYGEVMSGRACRRGLLAVACCVVDPQKAIEPANSGGRRARQLVNGRTRGVGDAGFRHARVAGEPRSRSLWGEHSDLSGLIT